MMRVNVVQKARKAPGTCESCREVIPTGSGYQWIKPRYGSRRVRHLTCPRWRPSEMTSSKMAGILAAQEAFADGSPYETKDDLDEALSTAAEEIRAVAEEYRESAQNIVDGFGHDTFMSDELNEKADELETWADEVENASDAVDDPLCDECQQSEEDGPHHEFEPRTVPGGDVISEEQVVCAVEGCEEPEDDHHDYEEAELDTSDAEAIVDACPV